MRLIRETKEALRSVPVLGPVLRAVVRPFRGTRPVEISVRQYCLNLPKFVPQPVFVNIGANDGITNDPVSDILLADTRWKGMLVEPVPSCFKRLSANFSDRRRFFLEQVAIGKVDGTAIFYSVDERAAEAIPNLPEWWDELGSFDRNHIVKHLDGALEPFIEEWHVPIRTLPGLLAKNGMESIQFLQIDTEGYDYEVLKSVDLSNRPPEAILAEYKNLPAGQSAEMLRLLRQNGYRVDFCGGDYFAIHRKSPLRKLSRDMAAAR